MTTKKAPQSVKGKKDVTKATMPEKAPVVGLQVLAMQLENIKRVGFARIRPKGNVVEVVGANGSGKTTVLDGIDWALTGMGHVTSEPIRQGHDRGEIQLVVGPMNEASRGMGTLKIKRTFTRLDPTTNLKGEKFLSQLTVSSDDARYNSPQKVLDELLRRISFDPLAFLRMPGKEQMETLRKLAGLDVELAELDGRKEAAYNERRELKRDAERAEAAFAALPKPADDLPAQPVDMAELSKQMSEAQQHNEDAVRLERQKDEHELMATRLEEDAGKLKRRIEEMQKLHDGALRGAQAARERGAAITVPEPVDMGEIGAKFASATETNRLIDKRTQWEEEQQRAAQARAAAEAKDAELKQLEQQRADALARAKMPLPELAIGDGEVLYRGLPLEQASNAEQIRVSAALAMGSSPKLRVMCIRDGSLLDERSMAMLAEMCQDEQYQLWIERVQSTGAPSVMMVDGEASGDDVEVVK